MIPIKFREHLGIEEDSLLTVTMEDDVLRIRPVEFTDQLEGTLSLKRLYERFAPIRNEIDGQGLSEDEVNRTIDQSVHAVRRTYDQGCLLFTASPLDRGIVDTRTRWDCPAGELVSERAPITPANRACRRS